MPFSDADRLDKYPLTDAQRLNADRVRQIIWSAQQICMHPEVIQVYQKVFGYKTSNDENVYLAQCGICDLRGWYTRAEPTITWVKGWERVSAPRMYLSGTPHSISILEAASNKIPEPELA